MKHHAENFLKEPQQKGNRNIDVAAFHVNESQAIRKKSFPSTLRIQCFDHDDAY